MSPHDGAGRSCPLRYRYGPDALRRAREQPAHTLYVIGGLYGNLPALNAIGSLSAQERGAVTLCFNGDFNWFNVDDAGFVAVNEAVLRHDAIQGNVEAELSAPDDEAGCGCAYPVKVEAGVVERSNLIHARLKATARRHSAVLARLEILPMVRRYRIGDCRIGVVHGDAESLAGWRFDVAALDDPAQTPWLSDAFAESGVDLFASTHTCLPALRSYQFGGAPCRVINNGAAGMPNFYDQRCGLITRISLNPAPFAVTHAEQHGAVQVAAVPVEYDHACWLAMFLANWPEGSPAHQSYFKRICCGPNHAPEQAYRLGETGSPALAAT